MKELINRGGEKVSPYDVESAILKHHKVKISAVFPYFNQYQEESVGAVVVLNENMHLSLIELRNYLKDFISSFKLPTLLYVVDEIPLSDNYKYQRRQLFNQLKDKVKGETIEEIKSIKNDEVLSEIQLEVKKIWLDVLRLNDCSIKDDFVDIGGDSLKSAEIFAAIEEKYHVQIPLTDFFKNGTIEKISKLIENLAYNTNYNYLVPLKLGGQKEPLIFVHTRSGTAEDYHLLAGELKIDRPIYGLQFNFDSNRLAYPPTTEMMIEEYFNEIEKLQPNGSFYFAGLSYGGRIALELARQMELRSKKVGNVFLFDTGINNTSTIKTQKAGKYYLIRRLKRALIELEEVDDEFRSMVFLRKMRLLFNLLIWNKISGLLVKFTIEQSIKKKKKLYTYQRKFILNKLFKKLPISSYTFNIVYFYATLTNKTEINDIKSKLGEKCEVISFDCEHADFVKGQKYKQTAREMEKFLT